MKNADDILKKILLNMKYDSKKTLNENLNEQKKPVISVGEIEKISDEVEYKDAVGGTLLLPSNAKILRYISKSEYDSGINNIEYIKKSFPMFIQMCKNRQPSDINKCLVDGYQHWVNTLTNEYGVGKFEIDGKVYNSCWQKKINGSWLLPKDSNFSGYYTGEPISPGECGRYKWDNKSITDKGDDTKSDFGGDQEFTLNLEL